jgi:hypothetical protein
MIHMEERDRKIVMDILAKYPYTFCAFGSRVHGNPWKFSDLDLCFFEAIPVSVLSQLKEDFEESWLPYKVDLVDWNMCDKDFQSVITKDLILIQGNPELLPKLGKQINDD